MVFRNIALRSSVLLLLVNSTFTQEEGLTCSKGTKYIKAKVVSEISTQPYFAQTEEFCKKKSKGGETKHGPYRLFGPNDEIFEEGQFVNGKKEGKWKRWIPSQILEDIWSNGTFVTSTVIGRPSSYVIDFKTCNKHEYGIPAVFGSTFYQVLGIEGTFCRLIYSVEIEMGQGPEIYCSVPTKKGKLTFYNTQYGLDFSILGGYCKQQTTKSKTLPF